MVTELATRQTNPAAVLEKVIVYGDLEALTPPERVSYYQAICDSMGLNALGRPFEYLKLNNKLVLYARKEATDQIREKRNVSIVITARERLDDLYIVTARATMPDGRTDESTGVVTIGGLKGDFLANACMKAETKSKRRVTLSICGLGFLDETEVDSIAGARRVVVDGATGEIIDTTPAAPAPSDVMKRSQLLTLIGIDAVQLLVGREQLDKDASKKDGVARYEDASIPYLEALQKRLADKVAASAKAAAADNTTKGEA